MNFDEIPSDQDIQKTVTALKGNNFEPEVLNTGAEALQRIKELIPQGASVMNGASETLHQIGYTEYLKSGESGWNNLHAKILAETDPVKQALLRRQSVVSDFYVGSVHALTQTGELLIASNTGSQLSHSAYTSPNLIYVVGAQKIVPTVQYGMQRIEEYVVPLEDQRMKEALGYGTVYAKLLILRKENSSLGRKVHVIIVKEKLGF